MGWSSGKGTLPEFEFPRPAWWMVRTGSCKLSSNLYRVCTYIRVYTKKNIILEIFR